MDKKLISKIFAEIKKTPTSVTAYEDMFALCRNIEPEDFTLAHLRFIPLTLVMPL